MTIDAAEYFSSLLDADKKMSVGLAAVEALMWHIEKSQAKTVSELMKDLESLKWRMASRTDHTSKVIQTASEHFMRFISLAPEEQNVQEMSALMEFYKRRGRHFVNSVRESRHQISVFARPFIKNSMRILAHAYSRVVIEALLNAKKSGVNAHVFVTESCPDFSGRRTLEELKEAGIQCTLVADCATGHLMESLDMVVVGAEGVMETGGIINKIGTLTLAVCAKEMNIPFYVMAESFKFIKEYPLNQGDIPAEMQHYMSKNSERHPMVDYTPPQYIKLLFTDHGILTPAAVGDELIKLYT